MYQSSSWLIHSEDTNIIHGRERKRMTTSSLFASTQTDPTHEHILEHVYIDHYRESLISYSCYILPLRHLHCPQHLSCSIFVVVVYHFSHFVTVCFLSFSFKHTLALIVFLFPLYLCLFLLVTQGDVCQDKHKMITSESGPHSISMNTTGSNNQSDNGSDSSSSSNHPAEGEDKPRPSLYQSKELTIKTVKTTKFNTTTNKKMFRTRRKQTTNRKDRAKKVPEVPMSKFDNNNSKLPLNWYFEKLTMVNQAKEHDSDSVVELTDSDLEGDEDQDLMTECPSYSQSVNLFHERCSCNHLHKNQDNLNTGLDLSSSYIEDLKKKQSKTNLTTTTFSHSCELLMLCDDNTSDLTCSPVRPASSQSTLSLSDSPANNSPNSLDSFRGVSDTNDHNEHEHILSSNATPELTMPKSQSPRLPLLGLSFEKDALNDSIQEFSSFQKSIKKVCIPSPWPVSPTVHMIRMSLSHLTRLQDFNVVSLSHGFFAQVFKVSSFLSNFFNVH